MARRDEGQRRQTPESKRIKNNPYAVKGHRVGAYEGGVIVTQKNPDGSIIRYVINPDGSRTYLSDDQAS